MPTDARKARLGRCDAAPRAVDRRHLPCRWRLGAGGALIAGMLAVSAAFSAPSHACSHPAEQDVYKIQHEQFGEIGRHVVTYTCQGGNLLVETEISGEVTLLSLPVYKLAGTYREVWRGDRLVSFDSKLDDNGEKFEVSARAEGEHMLIDRRRGRIEAPASIVSDHPWNVAMLDRTLLFDSRRGKLRHVEVEPAGKEALMIGGHEVMADKYRMTGDLERMHWYAEDGSWLQSQLEYGGAKVLVTLEE
jgi:Family of unknown function (DUF6134)